MIQLVIPTYKRLDKQITLNSIPKRFRRHVTLVVQPQEQQDALEIHPKIFVLSDNDIGIAQTRKEIAREWGCNRKVRHWVLDDDLKILKEFTKKKYQISLPAIKKKFEMDFYKWSFNDPLKINQYGIPEPNPKKKIYPDIILVPLVAFDNSLNRLGYGGGYYDRVIKKLSEK